MKILKAPSGLGVNPGGCWKRISGIRRLDRFDGILILMVLLYAIILSYLSILRYNTFQLEYDLAVFNQSFWNTVVNGELMTNSLEQLAYNMTVGSHLGVHFSPIIFSLIPVYAIFPVPQTFLIVQSVLLALGAVPVYLCGRELLGKGAGCIVALLYLIYPSLHGVNLYDFHEVAFLPVLLGFALWGLVSGRRNLMLIFGLLSLCVKEDVSLLVCMIGLVGLYQTKGESLKQRCHFFVLIIAAICTLVIFLFVIQPVFIPSFSSTGSGFLNQYLHPLNTVTQHSSYRIDYVLQTFAPLLFIPLAAPEVILIGIPSFIEILFSGTVYYSVYFHYSALIIPVIFFATIIALTRILSWEAKKKKRLFLPIICLMLISSLICLGMYSPAVKLIGSKGTYDEGAIDNHREYVEQVISLIPRDASISTQYNLLPQVSSRKQIWVDYHEGADIILLDNAFAWRAKDFSDNQKEIDDGYDLVLKKEYISLYVEKSKTDLRNELNKTLSSL